MTDRPRLLYQKLREQNEGLAKVLDDVYEVSDEIWSRPALKRFTEHGRKHTDQVEENLDRLTLQLMKSPGDLEDPLRGPLTPQEIFVLLSACCLHDVGMQRDLPDARDQHAQYAYDLIVNSSSTSAPLVPDGHKILLPVEDATTRGAIALIARAHWVDFAVGSIDGAVSPLPGIAMIGNNRRGRLRLLGALLAMADLLDLSPVRAVYFRSAQRLDTLPPVSELHQKMHALVNGCWLAAEDERVPGELQFRVEWLSNGQAVRELSDWVLTWFDSQWRRLRHALRAESGGRVAWASPWAVASFNPLPGAAPPELGDEAAAELKAVRAEERRIDRDEFAHRFRELVAPRDPTRERPPTLFRFPSGEDSDGKMMSEWLRSQARLLKGCRAALVEMPSSEKWLSLPTIVSYLMRGWGQPGSPSGRKALQHLRQFITTTSEHLVSTLVLDAWRNREQKLLQPLLEVLMQRPGGRPDAARLCLLLTPGGQGHAALHGAEVVSLGASPLSRADVERHLQVRHGYDQEESRKKYDAFAALRLSGNSSMAYTFVERFCGLSEAR